MHCNHIKPAPRSYICCLKALPIKGVLNSLSFSQAPYNAPASRVQHITVSVPSPWKRKGNKVSVTNWTVQSAQPTPLWTTDFWTVFFCLLCYRNRIKMHKLNFCPTLLRGSCTPSHLKSLHPSDFPDILVCQCGTVSLHSPRVNHIAAKHAKSCSMIDIATHNKQEFLSNRASVGSRDDVMWRAEHMEGGVWRRLVVVQVKRTVEKWSGEMCLAVAEPSKATTKKKTLSSCLLIAFKFLIFVANILEIPKIFYK